MDIRVVLMDSFTAKAGGGNPAGVVEHGESLTPEQMLETAKAVGFSETAFISSSKAADFRVRFFTPAAEVDLCGHATIAAFSHLFQTGRVRPGTYTQETGAGILQVEIQENGDIFMEQALPIFSETIQREQIADSLGVSVDAISEGFPVQIVSTGLRDILVPLRSLAHLRALKPDFEKIKTLSKNYDAVGYHVFTLETEGEGTAQCRNFAPLYDIPEESATGTSNGALSCYLWKHGCEKVQPGKTLVYEQGYTMGRPSEIKGLLSTKKTVKGEEIERILIGGRAVPWGDKIISL